MPVETIPSVLLVLLFAALLKGVTGLGFSTLSLPILVLFMEPPVAIALVLLPSLYSNFAVMNSPENLRIAFIRFWPLYLASLPGLLTGFALLISVDAAISRAVLGGVLVVYALWSLLAPPLTCPARLAAWLAVPVGFVTGLINGLTGSQVMPVLAYMLALGIDKTLLVPAINLSFTLSSLVMLVLLGGNGLASADQLGTALLAIPLVALGIHLGSRFRCRLPEANYRRAVLLVLLVTGLGLLMPK
jgi:uncharacterized membrane protein YfcA